jgi:sigma-E factor negative regulatory protein RseA
MSDKTREHISSLMDGEVSRETGRFLVRRLGSDEELCATWTRYHLVRDCLRHQEGAFSTEDLCQRVSRELSNESTPGGRVRGVSLAWLKPVAGAAVAASVALLAVLAVNPAGDQPAAAPGGLAESQSLQPFTTPQGTGAPVSTQVSLAGEQRMNAYLLRHYQASGAAGTRAFINYLPVMASGPMRSSNEGRVSQEDTAEAGKEEPRSTP